MYWAQVIPVTSAILAAILAAWLTPRFQHRTWQKQRIKETRLAITDRIRLLLANRLGFPSKDTTAFHELRMLLEVSTILFDLEETHEFAEHLADRMIEAFHTANLSDETYVSIVSDAAFFLMFAYGETFGVKGSNLVKRVTKKVDLMYARTLDKGVQDK